MDRLELHVRESGPDQRRETAVVVQPSLQRRESARELVGGWGDEAGVAGPGAADPVLRSADFAGHFVLAANTPHQDSVRVAQEADTQRKSVRVRNLSSCVHEGIHVVADLPDIIRAFASVRGFESEDVAKRGLGSFNPGGDDRFLAHESVKKPVGAGHHRPCYPQTGEGRLRVRVEFRCRSVHCQWRIGRRQRVRNERPDFLPEGADDSILTGLAGHGRETILS